LALMPPAGVLFENKIVTIERRAIMAHPYGPWATLIDAGQNPQLSTFWRRRLGMLVPTSQASPTLSRRNLLWLGAAAALMLVLPTAYPAVAADKEKPATLTYQIEPKSPGGKVTATDVTELLKVVQRRLNAGSEQLAAVRKLDSHTQRVELALTHPDDANRERVKRLLARPGTLEFRILANTRDNKDLIERAEKDTAKDELLDAAGKRLAWWVPVREALAQSLASYRDIAMRTKKTNGHEVTQILVIPDAQNVTGDYLKRVEAGADQAGRPMVRFAFNRKGGELFGKLTGEHLPDNASDHAYKLGVVFDGEMYSVPTLRARISEQGEITGRFTKDEVTDLANTLNAGSLPVRLRLIEKP
jgi:SecD/SecF fusion protein